MINDTLIIVKGNLTKEKPAKGVKILEIIPPKKDSEFLEQIADNIQDNNLPLNSLPKNVLKDIIYFIGKEVEIPVVTNLRQLINFCKSERRDYLREQINK